MDNDSADATSSGRSFQIHKLTTDSPVGNSKNNL